MTSTIADRPLSGAGKPVGPWAGRALSGLAVAFLLADGAMKFIQPAVVVETMRGLGWPADPATLVMLGILQLGATVLYVVPRTALPGAILLTGYLGGAVATHLRIGSPLFSHVLFGVYIGAMIWGGLWLRDARLRNLLAPARGAR